MRLERLITAFAVILAVGAGLRDKVDLWIDSTELPPLVSEVTTEVLDRNGDLLRAFQVSDGRWRMAVNVEQVDPIYIEMLVRFEDKRFFRHNGIDPLAMLRASGQALWNGKVISGASTLTMQTARLLEDSGTGSWKGKLRQVRVALALERHLSKQAILSTYLQHAPFGGNLEGGPIRQLRLLRKRAHPIDPQPKPHCSWPCLNRPRHDALTETQWSRKPRETACCFVSAIWASWIKMMPKPPNPK